MLKSVHSYTKIIFDREQRSKVLKEALLLLSFLLARFEKEQNVFANKTDSIKNFFW